MSICCLPFNRVGSRHGRIFQKVCAAALVRRRRSGAAHHRRSYHMVIGGNAANFTGASAINQHMHPWMGVYEDKGGN